MNKVGTTNQEKREQWLEKTLSQIPAGYKVLDAGAGELTYKKFCSHLQYTSQDFAQYDGQGNREGLQTKKWDGQKVDIISDITRIPVADNSFDVIMCIEVIEHIPEPALAIPEFARILKPGGQLILTAPFCSLTHFAPYYFANGYSKYWYQQILDQQGFEIKEITFNGNYFEYLAQEIHRIRYMANEYSVFSTCDKFFWKFLKPLMLFFLEKLSKTDHGSSEVLCFGLNILAIKR